jgi:hypothetical protein
MKKLSKSQLAWVIICFAIAAYSAAAVIYSLFQHYTSYINGFLVMGPILIFRVLISFMSVSLIFGLSHTRLGIRMLNTGRKYFEMPVVKYGAWKILASILITSVATSIILGGISVIVINYEFGEAAVTFDVVPLIVCLILMGIGLLVLWLGFRVRKAALRKTGSEIELLGETINTGK